MIGKSVWAFVLFAGEIDAWIVAVQRMVSILTYGVRVEWTVKEMNEAYV